MDSSTAMLQIVSERLRAQSLDEITNFNEPKGEEEEEEDIDSGTESDEELSSITQGMSSVPSPTLSTTAPTRVQAGPVPVPSASSPMFRQLARPTPLTTDTQVASTSSHDCSDYERCSLDFEPSNSTDSSVDYEHAFQPDYDLALLQLTNKLTPVLNGFPSMDKISDCDSELADLLTDMDTPLEEDLLEEEDDRSPVNRCGSCGSVSASDDEVRDLLDRKSPAPLRFRTSPPRGVHKLNKRTISPKVFLASINACYSSRFHHRHHRFANTGLIQRPHLDFEKMQVTRNTRILYSVV